MKKQEINKITKLLKQIKVSKNIIAKERDKARVIFYELEAEIQSWDDGVGEIAEGIILIENGLEDLSHDL